MKSNLKWRGFMSTTEYYLCMDLYGGNYNLVCSQSDVANILQLNITLRIYWLFKMKMIIMFPRRQSS